MEPEKLIARLLCEVVRPAVSKIENSTDDHIVLIRSNYRFRGANEKSIRDWSQNFNEVDLDLETKLEELVRNETGGKYYVKLETFSGYLGVSSDRYFLLVKSN